MLLPANLLQCLDIFAAQELDIGIVFIHSNYTILVTKNEICTFFIKKKEYVFCLLDNACHAFHKNFLKTWYTGTRAVFLVHYMHQCFTLVG